jgi:predicted ATPase
MRLIKLILQDYKAFAGKHEVEIRPLNILIGRNNSGKSALLHAPLLINPLLLHGHSIAGRHRNLELFHGKPYIGSLKFGVILQLSDHDSNLFLKQIHALLLSEKTQIKKIKIHENLSLIPPHRAIKKHGKKTTIETNSETINLQTNERHEIEIEKPNPKPKLIETFAPLITANIHSYFSTTKQIKIDKATTKQTKQTQKSNMRIDFLDIKTNQIQDPFEILTASTNHDWLLFEQVSDWYKENMGGWRLKKEEFDSYYAIRLVPPRGLDAYRESYTVDFEDAGTGMSAVLPMVVLSHLWRVGGAHISDELPPAIFLAEEPEHHLHPAAHGPLADLFIDLITNDSPHTVMVETHSEVFCLRAQRRVADGTIKPEDVIIHWMDDRSEPGMTRIVPIYIDEHGDTYRVDEQGQRFHFWPPGIFSEDYEEIREIEKLRRESKG